MAPPLSSEQLEFIHYEFYKEGNLYGRDKLFYLLRKKYKELSPSRRQVFDFIEEQRNLILYQMLKNKQYIIRKIIKPVIKYNKAYYEVELKDYEDNIIVERELLKEDIGPMILRFEKKNNIKFYDSKNKKTGKITRRYSIGKKED